MALFKSLTGQNNFHLPPGKIIYVFRTNEALHATLDEPDAFEYIIYRAKRGTVLITKPASRIFLNDSLVPLMKIISDGDTIKIGEESWQFIEIVKETLNDETVLLKMNEECKVCRDSFLLGDEVIQCPSCLDYCHYACWEYIEGKCPSRVCEYKDHRERKETSIG